MNGPTLFFLFGLPVVIAAAGWGAVLLNDWNERRRNHHPAE